MGVEADRAADQQEFLRQFLTSIDRAEAFVRGSGSGDAPRPADALHGAIPGPLRRRRGGGVYSAGPFDPEAATLFYLPTIPDDAGGGSRWLLPVVQHLTFRVTMIITHEICPALSGSSSLPKARVRCGRCSARRCSSRMGPLRGDDPERRLGRRPSPDAKLAHLRKRLENAVRAYVSVQVHRHGWDRGRLTRFAVDMGRCRRNLPKTPGAGCWSPRCNCRPIFWATAASASCTAPSGGGSATGSVPFNDAVLRSGGVPMDLLPEVLAGKP